MKISSAALSLISLFLPCELATAEKEISFTSSGVGGEEFFSQIVGGEPATAGEFKFMVSWHSDLSSKPSCGASLVAPNIVLSAAHCYNIPGNLRVGSIKARSTYDGNPPGVERQAIEKIKHPGYSFPNNDFMLMVLDEAVDTSVYPPIDLNFDPSKPATGADLTVIGFGTIKSGGSQPDELLKVDVPAVSHNVCAQQYSGINRDIHLCAGYTEGGKDSCQGDSGGPIFEEIGGVLKQVGVVSYGEGCAKAGKSGVYARVSGAQDWLTEEICNRSVNPKPSFCDGFQPTTQPPTVRPDCWDNPIDWHDGDGEEYNCEWYASAEENCEKWGDQFPNEGKTANEACCVCGGGIPNTDPSEDSEESEESPVESPVESPEFSPVEDPDDPEWTELFHERFVVGSQSPESDFFKVTNRNVKAGNPNHGEDFTNSALIKKTGKLNTKNLPNEYLESSELKVDFWAMADGQESGDGFVLEYTSRGSDWAEVEEWQFGTNYNNNEWLSYSATFVVPENAQKLKFRFRGLSGDRNDALYIDDVILSGN